MGPTYRAVLTLSINVSKLSIALPDACAWRAILKAFLLDFNFDIHSRREVQPHQHIDRFRIRIEYIDQAVMSADFKVLVRIFIDKS